MAATSLFSFSSSNTCNAVSNFAIQREILRGELYNTDKLKRGAQASSARKYYTVKPDITGDAGSGNKQNAVIDWALPHMPRLLDNVTE